MHSEESVVVMTPNERMTRLLDGRGHFPINEFPVSDNGQKCSDDLAKCLIFLLPCKKSLSTSKSGERVIIIKEYYYKRVICGRELHSKNNKRKP